MVRNQAEDQQDLFDIKGMVHRNDPSTSVDAATAMLPKLRALHAKVLSTLKFLGPMTDGELESLPEFAGYGPSTIRKRRSELYQCGKIKRVGLKRNERGRNMIVWAVDPKANEG